MNKEWRVDVDDRFLMTGIKCTECSAGVSPTAQQELPGLLLPEMQTVSFPVMTTPGQFCLEKSLNGAASVRKAYYICGY